MEARPPVLLSGAMRARSVLVAAVAAAPLTWAAGAQACSIAQPTPGAPLPGDVVFIGTVTDVPAVPEGPYSSADQVTYGFAVERVLKGSLPPGETTVWTARESASCGFEFTAGGRYLVSALNAEGRYENIPADALITGEGTGNRLLDLDGTVPADALWWPAPATFDTSASNAAPHDLRVFTGFPLYWLGAGGGTSGSLRSIVRSRNAMAVRYGRVTVTTTQMCLPTRGRAADPVTSRRAYGRVRTGVRRGALVLFTGRQEIRMAGMTPATARTLVPVLMSANVSAGTRYSGWPAAVAKAETRVPCPVPPAG